MTNKILILLCGALLLANTPVVFAETENAQNEQTDGMVYKPAGNENDADSQSEYAKIEQNRSNEKEVNVGEEKANCNTLKSPLFQSLKAADIRGWLTSHPDAVHFLLKPGLLIGGTIQLDDFSIWLVSPDHSYKVMNWLVTDQIVIRPNFWWKNHRFIIENIDARTVVEANLYLFLDPISHTIKNHRIVNMDPIQCKIWLEDGSVWIVDWRDYNPTWKRGQTIIIGINDNLYEQEIEPNILINAGLLQYARARCVYFQ